MTVDTNRAAFVQRSHEFHIFDDANVKAIYPDAREVTIEANVISTRASIVANAIMSDCAIFKSGIEIVIDELIDENDFKNDNMRFRVIYPRFDIDRICRVVSFQTEWLQGKTRLVLK